MLSSFYMANLSPGVENPKLILIMGCVGLTLNITSAIFLHGMPRVPSLMLEILN